MFSPQNIEEKYNYVKCIDENVHLELSNSMTSCNFISDICKELHSFVHVNIVLFKKYNLSDTLMQHAMGHVLR